DGILDAGRLQLNASQPAELESKALVEEALAFYLRLLEEKKTDPKLRLQTARAYNALAAAHNSLGDVAGTERAAHQSIDLLRGLIAEFPGEPTYRTLLGQVKRGLGTVIRSRFDQHPEAEELLRQGLDCYQALVSEFPERVDRLMELAGTYHELGYFQYSTGQTREAEQDYGRALELDQRAEVQFPEGSHTRAQRAFVHNSLGVLLRSTWRLAEAE